MPIFALISRTSIKFNTEWNPIEILVSFLLSKSGLVRSNPFCVEISKVCTGRD